MRNQPAERAATRQIWRRIGTDWSEAKAITRKDNGFAGRIAAATWMRPGGGSEGGRVVEPARLVPFWVTRGRRTPLKVRRKAPLLSMLIFKDSSIQVTQPEAGDPAFKWSAARR